MWRGVQEAARRDRYPPALSLKRALRPRCKIPLTSGPWRILRLAPWPPQDRLPTCAGRKSPRASEPAHCPAISLETAAAARGGQGQPDTPSSALTTTARLVPKARPRKWRRQSAPLKTPPLFHRRREVQRCSKRPVPYPKKPV